MKNSYLCKTALVAVISLYSHVAHAQQDSSWHWFDPSKSKFPVIEGQAWPGQMAAPYDRLPAKAEATVPPKVWGLSRQSAGLAIRFRTDASEIIVRYAVSGKLELPHMPATGVSGVDLYAIDPDGDWKWASGKYSFGDTITYKYTSLRGDMGEYRLYLPLYNTVKWLEIGVKGGNVITPLPVRGEKPIVIYGTSIAQGGCTSRPGMAWTAQLDRMMDRQVINLGFSGNGKLDTAVNTLLTDIDAKVYVLDCLPNITGLPPAEITQRVLTAVKQIRAKRPATPILLTQHAAVRQPLVNTGDRENQQTANKALLEAYDQLKEAGEKAVYVLKATQIGLDDESTVDGVHPNDVGMQLYAKAYAQSLQQILYEPIGDMSTTKPCRQYRELIRYDWDARHNTLLTMNRKDAPKVVLLGNSITHFWGGLPTGPIARGTDSWKAVMDPVGARNMGFGWDRVENVLWRVYHDELDGYEAKKILIMIGTNNLTMNTDEEIVAGLKQLVLAIRERQPRAGILLAGILPRADMAERVTRINKSILQLAGAVQVQYINPGQVLLKPDHTPDATLFTDGLHPNSTGYSKLAAFLKPYLQ